MNLIELHILQSFPVSCLNRDDVGSPKSALFGGTRRARISSQCLKRASRLLAHDLHRGFDGIRSRYLLAPFTDALLQAGLEEELAKAKADELCKLFSKPDSKNPDQVTTAVYLSPSEIANISTAIAAGEETKKAIKNATRNDAADIALFGRMVANDASLNVEGAAMFSHALSTHRTDNEVDFFSAVDDRKVDSEDAGASMIGTLEFNSATYYRYLAINLDLLASPQHLAGLSDDERKDILRTFIRSALVAVPGARKNSMNAGTLPHEVLGIRKPTGQPLQLINAFENPVKAHDNGFAEASLVAMNQHLADIERIWGDQGEKLYLTQTPGGIDAFIHQLLG
ncbi:CRISPR system Cascade subunit CasC [Haloferula luteola]|uniref:CRISPR system Cascade subunit CasC n=1 Tax=Haloferula luteola TaxID=595692 RepID=A0A840UYY9_9BACT|nr:type I-E CRISPR-associated protein Cas7/Cse4/CasC [Haloferula luteola]MBB5350955.1 CRISPR system Cascade subunit CasC [Haloferula luteola]